MKSDIEIATEANLLSMEEIRKGLDIKKEDYWPFGRFKGKVSLRTNERLKNKKDKPCVVSPAPCAINQ